MNKDDLANKQLSVSGFPFQLRVENEILLTELRHKWSVTTREHAWENPDATNAGFIDLALQQTNISTLRLVIECKRQRSNDASQLHWYFLLPQAEAIQKDTVRCLSLEAWLAFRPSQHWEIIRVWDDVRITPFSYESQFCVMNSDEKRRPILESLCRELLDSVDGLAEEEVKIAQRQSSHLRAFYIPVVVTNAQLAVCKFDPVSISLADGIIPQDKCEIEVVPFIRFRKSLVNTFPKDDAASNLRQANQSRERTVFVVNSEHLVDFLTGWDIKPLDEFSNYALARRLRDVQMRNNQS